jgi:hypothetical protein
VLPNFKEDEINRIRFDEPVADENWEEIEFKKIGKVP